MFCRCQQCKVIKKCVQSHFCLQRAGILLTFHSRFFDKVFVLDLCNWIFLSWHDNTYVIEYPYLDTTLLRSTNSNCHSYLLFYPYRLPLLVESFESIISTSINHPLKQQSLLKYQWPPKTASLVFTWANLNRNKPFCPFENTWTANIFIRRYGIEFSRNCPTKIQIPLKALISSTTLGFSRRFHN